MKKHNWLVDKPTIIELLDLISGEFIPATEIVNLEYGDINLEYDELINLRSDLSRRSKYNDPLYVCPLCGVPVYLLCSSRGEYDKPEDKRFFFRHKQEDGNCPHITRGGMSEKEILARKFNGQKESWAHKEMKEWVARSLEADGRFENIVVEKVWKDTNGDGWRKPDVAAVFNGVKIAFEVQLSTTFLHVLVERKVFYLRNGGLLFWIFKKIEKEKPRLMQDDLFYTNNRNLFVVSEDTVGRSEKEGRFYLDCHWTDPALEDHRQITSRAWQYDTVSIDDLTLDLTNQRVFFFDYKAKYQELVVEEEERQAEEEERQWLIEHQLAIIAEAEKRCELIVFTEDLSSDHNCSLVQQWLQIRDSYREQIEENWLLKGDIKAAFGRDRFTRYCFKSPGSFLNAIHSVKYGKPIGFEPGAKTLVRVAHFVFDEHKQFFLLFGWAIEIYKRGERIQKEDYSHSWKEKVDKYKIDYQWNDKRFLHDNRFDGLFLFLFPELKEFIGKCNAHTKKFLEKEYQREKAEKERQRIEAERLQALEEAEKERQRIEAERHRVLEEEKISIREQFEALWLSQSHYTEKTWRLKWFTFIFCLRDYDILSISFPGNKKEKSTILLNALYSAKHGKPVDFNFDKLIQIAHFTGDKSKEFLQIFIEALKIYKREEQIEQEDISKKWAVKIDEFRLLLEHDNRYLHDHKFDKLLVFLFPELEEALKIIRQRDIQYQQRQREKLHRQRIYQKFKQEYGAKLVELQKRCAGHTLQEYETLLIKEATRLIESDETVDLTSLCQWLGVVEDDEGYETAYSYAECIQDAADRFNKDLYLINSDVEKAVKEMFYG